MAIKVASEIPQSIFGNSIKSSDESSLLIEELGQQTERPANTPGGSTNTRREQTKQ